MALRCAGFNNVDLRAASRQGLEHRAVELVVHERADDGEALAKARRLRRQPRLKELELVSVSGVGRVQELAVVGFGAEHGNLHDAPPQ